MNLSPNLAKWIQLFYDQLKELNQTSRGIRNLLIDQNHLLNEIYPKEEPESDVVDQDGEVAKPEPKKKPKKKNVRK